MWGRSGRKSHQNEGVMGDFLAKHEPRDPGKSVMLHWEPRRGNWQKEDQDDQSFRNGWGKINDIVGNIYKRRVRGASRKKKTLRSGRLWGVFLSW